MKFDLVGAGDSVLFQRIESITLPGFQGLVDLIKKADIACVNLEGSTPVEPWHPAYKEDPIHVAYDAFVLDELVKMGFQVFNTANNHSGDYGTKGIVDTISELRSRKLIFMGTGMDLQEASAPVYTKTGSGTIAWIGLTASFLKESQAAVSGLGRSGKPGVNMLRCLPEFTLPYAEYNRLYDMWCYMNGQKNDADSKGFTWDGKLFVPYERKTFDYRVNQEDMQRINVVIEKARSKADVVIISVHDHLGRDGVECSLHPSDMMVEAFHSWIDEGADMIFAHGAHKMRPMELYKEKPVFYSTGNFMLDLRHLVKHPYGDLLHFGCKSMEEYIDFLCSAFDDDSWDSVLPYCHYQNGRFDKIQLYPISLAHDMADTQNYGMPELADGKRDRKSVV